MDQNTLTIVIGVAAALFVIWLIVRLTKRIKPMSPEESRNWDAAKLANEPTYAGKGAVKKKRWGPFLIIIIVIALALYLAYSGNLGFHP